MYDDENKENEPVNAKQGNAAKKESSPNWTTPEVIAACYAVLAANRKKGDQYKTKRADIAVDYYKKMATDLIRKGVWVPGKGGHPTLEASVHYRTKFPLTGHNKGKSPLYTKYGECTRVVHNTILPMVSRLLGPDKKPASGKNWSDFLATLKQEYYESWSSTRVKKRGRPMPEGMSPHLWAFYIFMRLISFAFLGSVERALL